MTESGTILSVQEEPVGSVLAADAALGASSVTVIDGSDFDEINGGTLLIGGTTYAYTAIDMDTGVITLTGTLAAGASDGDRVDVYDTALAQAAVETRALVALAGAQANDDAIDAVVARALATTLDLGIRDPGTEESCVMERRGDDWIVIDVRGKRAEVTPGGIAAHHTTHEAGGSDEILLDVSQIDATGTPSATTYLRGDGSWSTPAGGGLVTAALFGDGSDGTATFDGTATPAGTSKSGSTYTLTRDVYYTDATLSGSAIIQTAGYRIFCTGTLTIGSGCTIRNNGNNASSNTAGTAGSVGTVGNGTAGGNGSTSTLGAVGSSSSPSIGGAGGAGGNNSGSGGSGGGRAGGAATLLANQGTPRNIWQALAASTANVLGGGTALFTGGAGGGGGNSGGAGGTSGGGGAGGGIVAIFARLLVNSGAIEAKGGNGGNASGTTPSGGGGGGGGGAIIIISTSAQNGTLTVTGGTGGSAVLAGGTGVNGSTGNTYWLAA